MDLESSAYHIVCLRECGFRVHQDYYLQKNKKFTPGVCAKCGALTKIVKAYTDVTAPEAVMQMTGENAGQVRVIGRA